MSSAPRAARITAFAVHILTASGAVLALIALFEATHSDWTEMFVWLGVALIIDGIDGSLARRLRIGEVLPRWSGEVLDQVVDFATYVFVPAFAITASGLLPPIADIVLGILIVASGAIYFADRQMKQPGHFFRGFPALWNVAAFYLFVLAPPPWIGALGLSVLVVLTFLPFRFVHPVRVQRYRKLNIALLVLWSVLALIALWQQLDPDPWVVGGLSAIAVYFLAFGLIWSRESDDVRMHA